MVSLSSVMIKIGISLYRLWENYYTLFTILSPINNIDLLFQTILPSWNSKTRYRIRCRIRYAFAIYRYSIFLVAKL